MREDGEEIMKVVQCMLPTPLGLEDPFQDRCEEIEDGWRCAAAEREELVTPACSPLAES